MRYCSAHFQEPVLYPCFIDLCVQIVAGGSLDKNQDCKIVAASYLCCQTNIIESFDQLYKLSLSLDSVGRREVVVDDKVNTAKIDQ